MAAEVRSWTVGRLVVESFRWAWPGEVRALDWVPRLALSSRSYTGPKFMGITCGPWCVRVWFRKLWRAPRA